MLTLGNWEIILSLLTGGTKCMRLDFILQVQLNSTRQKICKEKHSSQELPQYRDNLRKTDQVLADLSSIFFLFSFQHNWQFFNSVCVEGKLFPL